MAALVARRAQTIMRSAKGRVNQRHAASRGANACTDFPRDARCIEANASALPATVIDAIETASDRRSAIAAPGSTTAGRTRNVKDRPRAESCTGRVISDRARVVSRKSGVISDRPRAVADLRGYGCT